MADVGRVGRKIVEHALMNARRVVKGDTSFTCSALDEDQVFPGAVLVEGVARLLAVPLETVPL